MARKLGALIFVFLAFYLGAHFWLRSRNTVTDDVTKISRLAECHPNQVRRVKILQQENGRTEEFSFERADPPQPGLPESTALARSAWRFSAGRSGEADATLLKRIVSTVCELYDPLVVRQEPKSKETGAQRKAQRLELEVEEGGKPVTLAFEFGEVTSDRMNLVRFDSPKGRSTVKIPARLLELASFPPSEFRNLRVMRLEADNVSRASVTIDGRERFILERAGADWRMISGNKDLGPASEEANRFVNRLSTLRALDVIDSAFPSERCGEEKSKVVIDFQGVGGRNESLRFDYRKGSELEACSTQRSTKFRVHHDLARFLDVPAKSLLTN